MVVPALENDAKSMTPLSEDGVDTTLEVIDKVVDIFSKIELRFDFDPTRRQKERMQADYFSEYLDSRTSLVQAGEEYNNAKEDLGFAREDRDEYSRAYQNALKDKSLGAEELKNIREQSITAGNNYRDLRKKYTSQRDDFSQAKVDYYSAANDYYESHAYPKQAWKKYQDKLKHENDTAPEIESLTNEVNLEDLNNEELKRQLDEWDQKLFNLINEKYAEEQTKQKINTEQKKQTQGDDIDTTYERVSQIINDAYTPEKTMEVDVDVAGIIPDPWMDEVTPVNHAEKLQVPRQEEHSYIVDEGIFSNDQIRNYTTTSENEVPAILDDRPGQIINQGTDRVLEMLETNYYETQHSILERNDEGGVSIWTKDNNGGATLEFHSDASGNIESSLSEDKSQQFVQLYQEKLDLNPSDAPDIQFQKAEDQAINNSLDLFLTEEQTNRYETDNYTIERNEEGGIDIKDKLSGRGIIFQSDDTGNIENRMLIQESENFTNFSVEVQEYAENKINAAVDKFMEAQNADSYETASFDFNKGVTGWEITNKDGGPALSHEQTKQLLEFSNKVNQAFANNELATSTVGKIKEETEEQER